MSKYIVSKTSDFTVEVEAENSEEAYRKAHDLNDDEWSEQDTETTGIELVDDEDEDE